MALPLFCCFFHVYQWYPYELGHLEMIGAIVHQLTRNLSENQ